MIPEAGLGRYTPCTGCSCMLRETEDAEAGQPAALARYRAVIAALQEGVVLLDADGTVHSCNPAGERILGVRAEQIAGRKPGEAGWRAIHDDGRPFSPESDPGQITLRTGRPCSGVIMGVRRVDGSLAWMSINTDPLFLPGAAGLAGGV